jgi:hypothetical protein
MSPTAIARNEGDTQMERMTVREYAAKEGITLGTAYRRIWEGQVRAEQFYGRWLISPSAPAVKQDCREYVPA